VFEEEEQEKEDNAVEELLAGEIPLLIGCDAEGEGHHENSAADKGVTSEDTNDEHEAEHGFEERDRVAETIRETVREWGFGEVFGGGLCKSGDAGVDADQSVAGEVYAERDAQEPVGEGLVADSHSSLRRAEGEPSYIWCRAKFGDGRG
jgi:hypothetical protein